MLFIARYTAVDQANELAGSLSTPVDPVGFSVNITRRRVGGGSRAAPHRINFLFQMMNVFDQWYCMYQVHSSAKESCKRDVKSAGLEVHLWQREDKNDEETTSPLRLIQIQYTCRSKARMKQETT